MTLFAPDGFTPIDAATIKTGGPAAEGMFITQPGIPSNQLSGAGKTFVEDFAKANGKEPDPYTNYAAQAAEVLLTAIDEAEGRREARSRSTCSTRT